MMETDKTTLEQWLKKFNGITPVETETYFYWKDGRVYEFNKPLSVTITLNPKEIIQ